MYKHVSCSAYRKINAVYMKFSKISYSTTMLINAGFHLNYTANSPSSWQILHGKETTGFLKFFIDKWSEYVIKQKRRCCFKLHLLLHCLNLRSPTRDLIVGLRRVLLFPSILGLFCSCFYALFLHVFEPFSDNIDAF